MQFRDIRPVRSVRQWGLWNCSKPLLTYVLVVEAIAATAVVGTAIGTPLTRIDWVRFGLLSVGAIVHVELSRGVDQMRNIQAGPAPSLDTKTVWSFAAVLVLPPVQASAMVVLTHAWAWWRVWRGRRPLYRWIFSAATVLIATQVAAAMVHADPTAALHGLPTSLGTLGIVAGAGAVRWLTNYGLVIGAIVLSSPRLRARQLLHNIDERILEAGALGLGLAAAGLVVYNPWLLVGVVMGLVAMHRSTLLPQLRRAATTDAKTGLYSTTWWHEMAKSALARASAAATQVGVLMLDLDHFKNVNDTYGHPAGDTILHAVAKAITAEIRASDVAGRWGGEEFVVLLPDPGSYEDLRLIAERLNRRIGALMVTITTPVGQTVVDNLTVSIGGAIYPSPGIETVDELVFAADTSLYRAKNNGRNQVQLANPDAGAA